MAPPGGRRPCPGVLGQEALAFSAFTYMRVLAFFLGRLVAYAAEVTSQQENGATDPKPGPAPRQPSALTPTDQLSWPAAVAG